jgi:hypothetical protein
MMHYRQYELPWGPGREADQRFGIILRKVILTVLVLTVILTYLPQPMGETGPGEDLVPRFAEEIPDEPQVLSPLVIESSRPEPVARTAPMRPVPVFATPRTVAIALPSRSREEIEKVFEQNRGVINALYNKALRRNPSLRGMLVLKMSIEPSGIVSNYEIVSSEFEDDQFLRKLTDWIQLFRFDAKKVAPVTVIKSIDFFPV